MKVALQNKYSKLYFGAIVPNELSASKFPENISKQLLTFIACIIDTSNYAKRNKVTSSKFCRLQKCDEMKP